MATKRAPRSRKRTARGVRTTRKPAAKGGFVGRDASPVLDHYPPKEPGSSPRAPPLVASSSPASVAPPGVLPTAPATPSPSVSPSSNSPLITLDRPFDVDEFSTLLGESSIRVTVPRESLAEVVHRVLEFMGFGIYVYTISVRPAPAELLKGFVVELQRVDYSAEKGAWVPFVEKGTTDSPFGPSGDRT